MGTEHTIEAVSPYLALLDNKSKGIKILAMKTKGLGDGRRIDRVTNAINTWGHNEIILRSDSEPSIKQVQQVIQERRTMKTIPENSPVRSKGSNGAVERAIRTVEAKARTMKVALGGVTGETYTNGDAVLEWMAEYAAQLYSRYHVGQDGKTAYGRLKGRESQRPIVQFGECVMFRPVKKNSDAMDKYEPRWLEGCWLGMVERSGEGIIHYNGEIVKCRSVRRRPLSERWNGKVLKAMIRTPAEPNGPNKNVHIGTQINKYRRRGRQNGNGREEEEGNDYRQETNTEDVYTKG